MQKTSERLAKFGYQLKNWAARIRAMLVLAGASAAGCLGAMSAYGELRATLIRRDGTRIDLGVLGRQMVTDAGVAFMVDDFDSGANSINLFNFHDSGIGTGAEAVGNTAMGTAAGPARVAGTRSQPAANQYRSVATIAYTATLAITEHGFFSALTNGTLWDRTLFAVISVVNGESIQFTYTLTINAGG